MSKLEKVIDRVNLLEGIVKKNQDNNAMLDDLTDILDRLNDYLTNDYEPKKKPLSKRKDHGMGFDLY